jgi:hypothetical protein
MVDLAAIHIFRLFIIAMLAHPSLLIPDGKDHFFVACRQKFMSI